MAPTTSRQLAKAAARIHATFASTNRRLPELPAAAWEECERQAALARLCRQRNWVVAAATSEARLLDALSDLIRRSHEFLRDEACQRRVETPTMREIFDDLRALEAEFPRVAIDLRACRVSVVTDPIVLEGVSLGSFEVALHGESLGRQSPSYTVTALEPRPAAPNDAVTHPHVIDDRLCEGEGRHAIGRALKGGRLFDFFTIVAQILETYNESSAYVTLDRWEGVSCTSCGQWLDADDGGECERCDGTLCGDCSLGCDACDRYVCGGCSAPCARCENCFCSACLISCEGCHDSCCSQCLTDGRCDPCREAADQDAELEPASSPPAGPASDGCPPDPLCLGQAQLLA